MKEIEHGRQLRKEMLDIIERADVAMAAGNLDKVRLGAQDEVRCEVFEVSKSSVDEVEL